MTAKVLPSPIQSLQMLKKEDGDLVRFSFDGGTLLELAVETQMIRSITRVEQNEMVLAKAAEAGFDDDKIASSSLPVWQMSQSWTVQNRVQHPGLASFVADQFGSDVEFTLSTSLDNQMLVSLSTGEILAVQACEVGNTPLYVEGELMPVVRSCGWLRKHPEQGRHG